MKVFAEGRVSQRRQPTPYLRSHLKYTLLCNRMNAGQERTSIFAVSQEHHSFSCHHVQTCSQEYYDLVDYTPLRSFCHSLLVVHTFALSNLNSHINSDSALCSVILFACPALLLIRHQRLELCLLFSRHARGCRGRLRIGRGDWLSSLNRSEQLFHSPPTYHTIQA